MNEHRLTCVVVAALAAVMLLSLACGGATTPPGATPSEASPVAPGSSQASPAPSEVEPTSGSLACGGATTPPGATPSEASPVAPGSSQASPAPSEVEPTSGSPDTIEPTALDEGKSPSGGLFESHYELNDYVTQDDFTLAVLGWGLSHGNERTQPEEGNVLLIVDMIMVNHGTEGLRQIPMHDLGVRDSQGIETPSTSRFYVPDFQQYPYFFGLAPGEGIRHLDIYEVAEGGNDYVLVFEPRSSDFAPDGSTFEIPLAKAAVAERLPTELLAPVPTVYAVGETFSIGRASLTVLGWESVPTSRPGYSNIGIDLAIENRGDELISLDSYTFLLRDRSGFRYDTDRTRPAPAEARLGSTTLEIGELFPGEHLRGEYFFRVPTNSHDLIFSFDPEGFSGSASERAFVELGTQPTEGSPPLGFCTQQGLPIQGMDAKVEVNGLDISVTGIEFSDIVESDLWVRALASGHQYVTVHATFENVVAADYTWLPEIPTLPPELATEMPEAAETFDDLLQDDRARERLVSILQLRDRDCRYYTLDLCEFEPPVSAACSMQYLSPGDVFNARIVFQVPIDVRELYLVYSITFPYEEKVVIELVP